jgi:hypothetical protein
MPLPMVAAIVAQGARHMTASNNDAAFSNDPTSLQAATPVVFRNCFFRRKEQACDNHSKKSKYNEVVPFERIANHGRGDLERLGRE